MARDVQVSAYVTRAQAKRWRHLSPDQIRARILWSFLRAQKKAKKQRRKAQHDARRRQQCPR